VQLHGLTLGAIEWGHYECGFIAHFQTQASMPTIPKNCRCIMRRRIVKTDRHKSMRIAPCLCVHPASCILHPAQFHLMLALYLAPARLRGAPWLAAVAVLEGTLFPAVSLAAMSARAGRRQGNARLCLRLSEQVGPDIFHSRYACTARRRAPALVVHNWRGMD
jgi:hypothetical protein